MYKLHELSFLMRNVTWCHGTIYLCGQAGLKSAFVQLSSRGQACISDFLQFNSMRPGIYLPKLYGQGAFSHHFYLTPYVYIVGCSTGCYYCVGTLQLYILSMWPSGFESHHCTIYIYVAKHVLFLTFYNLTFVARHFYPPKLYGQDVFPTIFILCLMYVASAPF